MVSAWDSPTHGDGDRVETRGFVRVPDVELIRPHAKVRVPPPDAYAERGRPRSAETASGCEGVLSERDIVRALGRHGADLLDMSVVAVMSRNVPV